MKSINKGWQKTSKSAERNWGKNLSQSIKKELRAAEQTNKWLEQLRLTVSSQTALMEL